MTTCNGNRPGPADLGPFDAMSRFRVTYDGPALESSEMDVRELAPALLAFGDLLDASTRALCGAQVRPQVNVRGGFLSRVNNSQISFSKGDVLLCNVRMQQWQTSDGAKTEYEVTDVLEHRPAGRQIQLPGL